MKITSISIVILNYFFKTVINISASIDPDLSRFPPIATKASTLKIQEY